MPPLYAEGEIPTANYLGPHASAMSTVARREALLASKLFVCGCARCACRDDPARLLPCPGCHPRGDNGALPGLVAVERCAVRYAVPRYAAGARADDAPTWHCAHCGGAWGCEAVLPAPAPHAPGRAWERALERRVLAIDPRCGGGGDGPSRDQAEEVARLVTGALGARHWAGKRARQIWKVKVSLQIWTGV